MAEKTQVRASSKISHEGGIEMQEDQPRVNSGQETDIAAENARSQSHDHHEIAIVSPSSVITPPEKQPDVKMGPKGIELVFPRVDNVFTHKESLNFQDFQSRVWQTRKSEDYDKMKEYGAFIVLGFFVGIVGFGMDVLEQLLVYIKDVVTQHFIDQQSIIGAWLFYSIYGTILVLISTAMTLFWGTGAMGSGVAEVIAVVNGIVYPAAINVKTIITKIIGVVLAVVGGLAVGKEGPLAHIGANLGCATVYLPGLEFLRNNLNKRELLAAGASAGVSCAFGAPIGGALFLYELSRGNPVWTFQLLWKTFFTCCTAVFTMGFFDNLLHGEKIDWSESALKFAKSQPDVVQPTFVLLGAVIIGSVSGLLGALFINLNFRINALRGAFSTKPWHKLVEAAVFAFASASAFYWVPYMLSSCLPNQSPNLDKAFTDKTLSIWDKSSDYDISKAWCAEGTYNPLATLMWKTEAGVIRQMMDADVHATQGQMFAFAGVWYFFFVTTYGIFLPSGLFLPGMIIGCAIGDLYNHFCLATGMIEKSQFNDYRVTFIILAMCSMLAGYTRMTYSIIVVTMETCQSVNIFLPVVLACGASNVVGDIFNRSLYERAVRGKQMPILIKEVPHSNRFIRAEQIMTRPVKCINCVESVQNIYKNLQTCHNAFPVVNKDQILVGLISRNHLVSLIQNKKFYTKATQVEALNNSVNSNSNLKNQNLIVSEQQYFNSEMLDTNEFPITKEDEKLTWKHFLVGFEGKDFQLSDSDCTICEQNSSELIDLRPYMVEQPIVCQKLDFLPQIVSKFRDLHLRHLIVMSNKTGSIDGIITRQDIFKWMPL